MIKCMIAESAKLFDDSLTHEVIIKLTIARILTKTINLAITVGLIKKGGWNGQPLAKSFTTL